MSTESDAKTELQMLAYEAERMLDFPVFVAPEAWQQHVRLMARATTALFAAANLDAGGTS